MIKHTNKKQRLQLFYEQMYEQYEADMTSFRQKIGDLENSVHILAIKDLAISERKL